MSTDFRPILGPKVTVSAESLPLASRLVITQVHNGVEGDVFFPAIDRELWRETAPEERAE